LTSPYTLGQSLVQTVAADGGNTAVNDLLRSTPKHEKALLDPFTVLADKTGATPVDVPKIKEGEKEFDSGEFGVLTWYLMLAERLPLLDSLAAADGWGGDAYVSYQNSDGDSCARLTYAGDTPRDTNRMYTALRRWVAAAPGSPAEVSRTGAQIRFQSCDPGKAAKVGKDASQKAVALVVTRTYLGLGIMKSGGPESLSRCVAGKLVETYPASRLANPRFGADNAEVQARVRAMAAACR
jgi:hypothetical protein